LIILVIAWCKRNTKKTSPEQLHSWLFELFLIHSEDVYHHLCCDVELTITVQKYLCNQEYSVISLSCLVLSHKLQLKKVAFK